MGNRRPQKVKPEQVLFHAVMIKKMVTLKVRQKELCLACGVDAGMMSNWISRRHYPSFAMVVRIANHLSIDLFELQKRCHEECPVG